MRDISTNCLVFQRFTQSLLSSKKACLNVAFYKDFPVQSLIILMRINQQISIRKFQVLLIFSRDCDQLIVRLVLRCSGYCVFRRAVP